MQKTKQIFDTKLVRLRRSKALANPDYPDFLDQIMADEFISRLSLIDRKFETCLVLGQPAPVLLERLSDSPKLGRLIFQPTPSEQKANIAFNDEFLPFAANSLDCVIAGSGLELINDLPGLLIQVSRALRPDGLFLAAMLSGPTLNELRYAFATAEQEHCGSPSPRVIPFADVRQTGNLLSRARLALPVSDRDSYTVRYDNAHGLMKDLKALGLTNPLFDRSKTFTSSALLEKVNEIYARLFSDEDGRIRATFEFNFLTAWSPHESQQQPLKPGTAQLRLADALKDKS